MKQSHIKSYIVSINVEGLNNQHNIRWNLTKEVNVITGVNGSGKSTILQSLSDVLKKGKLEKSHKPIRKITIEFENGDIFTVLPTDYNNNVIMSNVDIISTFDSSALIVEAMKKMTNNVVCTDLDWVLYQAMDRFLKYQLHIGKQAIKLLLNQKEGSKLPIVSQNRTLFYDILDDSFKESNKTVIRDSDELTFDLNGIELSPYQLSSGEKQFIIILTLVLTQNKEPYLLIMDEPENSLHFEWQKKLLNNILRLNPNVQIITSTHSPAMIMDGWMSRVTDLNDLILTD